MSVIQQSDDLIGSIRAAENHVSVPGVNLNNQGISCGSERKAKQYDQMDAKRK